MNGTIREATVKRFHYESHHQLRVHLADLMAAYNFGRRLKTFGGLTPYAFIVEIWASEPQRFNQFDPPDAGAIHLFIFFIFINKKIYMPCDFIQ